MHCVLSFYIRTFFKQDQNDISGRSHVVYLISYVNFNFFVLEQRKRVLRKLHAVYVSFGLLSA